MKNFSISRLADMILTQRKLLGLTQQELADKAGINRSMLCRLENQDYVPSLDQLTRLANTLQFDVSDVFIEYQPPVFHRVVSRNITVFGAGYAGLSTATLLARHHKVMLVDSDPGTVDRINHRVSPVRDEYIEKHFAKANLDLIATDDGNTACANADYIVIAVPAGYDPVHNRFDSSAVEDAVRQAVECNPDAVIVIRSTVPVGYTASLQKRLGSGSILFVPEFLRESNALYDSLYPGRIIVGCDESVREQARAFAALLKGAALKKDVEILVMGTAEAETVKLFSDTYLALRSSFFNDLDTFAEIRQLNAGNIIQGVCLDPRIGVAYNNPSFGCEDFCLPGNARQLRSCLDNVPHVILSAVMECGRERMDHIAERALEIASAGPNDSVMNGGTDRRCVVGVFRPAESSGLEHFGRSAAAGIIRRLKGAGAAVVIYEPSLEDNSSFFGCKVINDLRKFKKQSHAIIADRCDSCLDDVEKKVYSRDLFGRG